MNYRQLTSNSLGKFPEVVRWMEEGKLSPAGSPWHPEEVSKVVLL